jgi:hypothetical protein
MMTFFEAPFLLETFAIDNTYAESREWWLNLADSHLTQYLYWCPWQGFCPIDRIWTDFKIWRMHRTSYLVDYDIFVDAIFKKGLPWRLGGRGGSVEVRHHP